MVLLQFNENNRGVIVRGLHRNYNIRNEWMVLDRDWESTPMGLRYKAARAWTIDAAGDIQMEKHGFGETMNLTSEDLLVLILKADRF